MLDGRSLDDALAASPPPVDERDRALSAELSYGVCRWYRRLDALVGALLTKPFKRRDRDLHLLLLVGAYQLLYSRVPPHAAISSSVDGSRALGKGWASKVVNGVLRRLQRERESLERKVDADPAVCFAQPDWLYNRLRTAWPGQLDTILPALQTRPTMVLRVDQRRIGRDAYVVRLHGAGLTALSHPTVPTALALDRPVAVADLPGFAEGLVSVQDAGAQLAATYLDLSDGLSVLDACAAPGGKTLAILQSAARLDVTALDIDRGRLQKVEDNLRRGGVGARLFAGDAACSQGTDWGARRYDRILLDAPCSATGVLARHPDIRLLRRATDIDALADRQAALLDALWPLLSPGGRLLYVTCSLLPTENEQQIAAFIARCPDASTVELPAVPGINTGEGVQLLPGIDATDGFYYAALVKGAARDPEA